MTTSPSLPPPARPGLRWSASGLTTYTECGERWRRKYIEQEWSLPSAKMARGTAVHERVAKAYRLRLAGRPLPSAEETRDLCATEFDRIWDTGIRLEADEVAEGDAKVKARHKDFAISLAVHHVQRVAPAVRPLHVERRIIVPLGDTLELHGILDLISKRPEDSGGGEIVRDLKTAEKSPVADTADNSLQLTMYAALREGETGTIPPLALDHLIRTPSAKTMSHVVQVTTRSRDDVAALTHRVERAAQGVEAGVFLPSSPESWRCSAKGCEFWTSCVWGERGRSSRPQS